MDAENDIDSDYKGVRGDNRRGERGRGGRKDRKPRERIRRERDSRIFKVSLVAFCSIKLKMLNFHAWIGTCSLNTLGLYYLPSAKRTYFKFNNVLPDLLSIYLKV